MLALGLESIIMRTVAISTDGILHKRTSLHRKAEITPYRLERCTKVLLYRNHWRYVCAMLISYARVSSNEQDTAAQVAALKAAKCERIYREQASGRWDRPELERPLDQLRKGNVLVVWKLDWLSRSLRDVLTIMGAVGGGQKLGFGGRLTAHIAVSADPEPTDIDFCRVVRCIPACSITTAPSPCSLLVTMALTTVRFGCGPSLLVAHRHRNRGM